MRQTGLHTTRRLGSPRPVRVASLAIAAVLAGGVLAACSSSTPDQSATSSTTTSGGGSDSGADSGSFSSRLTGDSGKSFKVVYEVSSGGTTQQVTFAQSPPKSAIITKDATVISDGTKTVTCSGTGSDATCVNLGSSMSSPVAAITSLFDAKAVRSMLQGFEAQSVAKAAGITIEESTKEIAGGTSSCVTVTTKGAKDGTWCVTPQGLVSYVQTADSSLTLVSFTTDVPPADFETPSGATVVTVPGQ